MVLDARQQSAGMTAEGLRLAVQLRRAKKKCLRKTKGVKLTTL